MGSVGWQQVFRRAGKAQRRVAGLSAALSPAAANRAILARTTSAERLREVMMARIVLGMGTSHTPMLNAPPTDWPRFIERDAKRTNLLDIDGNLTSYEAQLNRAPADIDAQIAPERMAARHAAVEGAMARLGDYLRPEEHTSELQSHSFTL